MQPECTFIATQLLRSFSQNLQCHSVKFRGVPVSPGWDSSESCFRTLISCTSECHFNHRQEFKHAIPPIDTGICSLNASSYTSMMLAGYAGLQTLFQQQCKVVGIQAWIPSEIWSPSILSSQLTSCQCYRFPPSKCQTRLNNPSLLCIYFGDSLQVNSFTITSASSVNTELWSGTWARRFGSAHPWACPTRFRAYFRPAQCHNVDCISLKFPHRLIAEPVPLQPTRPGPHKSANPTQQSFLLCPG